MTPDDRSSQREGDVLRAELTRVVVLAAEPERRDQYEAALGAAGLTARITLDPDEAETLVTTLRPRVLVLDRGLPRLVLFRLYGLVRDEAREPLVQVVFVGQEGDTGPDDHYLPGEPTFEAVAAQATALVAGESAAAAPPPGATADDQPTAAGDGPLSTAERGPAGEGLPTTAAAAPTEMPPRRWRLDVILIRVGLALLFLGAIALLIQSEAIPMPIGAPASEPPTRTPRPAATPKPAALLDAGGAPVAVPARVG